MTTWYDQVRATSEVGNAAIISSIAGVLRRFCTQKNKHPVSIERTIYGINWDGLRCYTTGINVEDGAGSISVEEWVKQHIKIDLYKVATGHDSNHD